MKDIKVFLKQKEEKNHNMVVDDTKVYQKVKSKSWLSIEKNIKWEKCFIIIIKKYFCLEKSTSILKRV